MPTKSSRPAGLRGRKVDGYNMMGGNYNTTQELAPCREVGVGK